MKRNIKIEFSLLSIIAVIIISYFIIKLFFMVPNERDVYIQEVCIRNKLFHVVKTDNSFTNFQYLQVLDEDGKPETCNRNKEIINKIILRSEVW